MLYMLITGLLIWVRLLAVTFTAPILGNRHVGIWPRLVIAAGLTMVVSPIVAAVQLPVTPIEFGEAVLSEALIGAMLGLGMTILFAAATAAGNVVGQMAGIQLFAGADQSTEISGSSLGQLLGLLSIAVFALMGGIELVMSGVLDSFAALPLGTSLEIQNLVGMTTQLLQQSFVLVLRCIAPSVVAMFIATYVIGMISRTFPSMNSMGVGLSSNLVIMLLAMFLTLGGTMWLLVGDMQQATEWMNSTMEQIASNKIDG